MYKSIFYCCLLATREPGNLFLLSFGDVGKCSFSILAQNNSSSSGNENSGNENSDDNETNLWTASEIHSKRKMKQSNEGEQPCVIRDVTDFRIIGKKEPQEQTKPR